jgi:hypoxanthine phosphoribosyltransferase
VTSPIWRTSWASDVADTGATLHFVRDLLPDAADVRVAVIYEKPHTTYAPELAWRSTDKWIRFPWIQVPPVRIQEAGRSSV